MLHEKLLNPGTRWESNDLTDLIYRTCVVGYADHVLPGQREHAERSDAWVRAEAAKA